MKIIENNGGNDNRQQQNNNPQNPNVHQPGLNLPNPDGIRGGYNRGNFLCTK